VGSILRKPVVIGDSDRIEIRPMMVLTLSADHRIVDGVVAARFLNDLQLAIETPGALFYV
jgi:pyruvate dehydrogenase E2 component (dihydrolipoamide acetyltransferase)